MRTVSYLEWLSGEFDPNELVEVYGTHFTVYYLDEKLHNDLGPAYIIRSTGVQKWALHGVFIDVKTQEEFERYIKLKAFW
jgi:hypothetical protein